MTTPTFSPSPAHPDDVELTAAALSSEPLGRGIKPHPRSYRRRDGHTRHS